MLVTLSNTRTFPAHRTAITAAAAAAAATCARGGSSRSDASTRRYPPRRPRHPLRAAVPPLPAECRVCPLAGQGHGTQAPTTPQAPGGRGPRRTKATPHQQQRTRASPSGSWGRVGSTRGGSGGTVCARCDRRSRPPAHVRRARTGGETDEPKLLKKQRGSCCCSLFSVRVWNSGWNGTPSRRPPLPRSTTSSPAPR